MIDEFHQKEKLIFVIIWNKTKIRAEVYVNKNEETGD